MKPYQDFRINFPNHEIVLEGTFSKATAAGLVYGVDFGGLTVMNFTPGLRMETPVYFRNIRVYTPLYRLMTNTDPLDDFLVKELIDEYGLTREDILNVVGSDTFVLSVYEDLSPQEGEESIVILQFSTEQELSDFLRGLLTMVQAFNIDPSKAFPVAPFRGDIDYMINNIRLRRLQ